MIGSYRHISNLHLTTFKINLIWMAGKLMHCDWSAFGFISIRPVCSVLIYRSKVPSRWHIYCRYPFCNRNINFLIKLRSIILGQQALATFIWYLMLTNENLKDTKPTLMDFTFSLKAILKPHPNQYIMVWNAIDKLFKSNDAEIRRRTTTFTSHSTIAPKRKTNTMKVFLSLFDLNSKNR